MVKSNKQRKRELTLAKLKSTAKRKTQLAEEKLLLELELIPGAVRVNRAALVPSFTSGEFEKRGYYLDEPFNCKDCGVEQIWTATQQKWWYEIAKGAPATKAVRCRACRAKQRANRDTDPGDDKRKRAKN